MKRLWIIAAALLLGADLLACTTAVVSAGASASGRPMLWKQRDASDPYNRIVHVKDGAQIAYTALFPTSDSLCTLAYAGINAAGFGVMNNLSYNLRPDSLGFDTKAGPLMARALGCCRTVDDFERLLREKERPMLLSTNFGVVDAEGGEELFHRLGGPDDGQPLHQQLLTVEVVAVVAQGIGQRLEAGIVEA